MNANIINELAAKLIEAKEVESAARAHRLEVEQEIIEVVGVKDEGSTTIKNDYFAVTTTGKVTRSLDVDRLVAIKDRIPKPIMDKLVKIKPQLDTRSLRYIESNEPDIYQIFSQALTIKPAKPSVTIKEIA